MNLWSMDFFYSLLHVYFGIWFLLTIILLVPCWVQVRCGEEGCCGEYHECLQSCSGLIFVHMLIGWLHILLIEIHCCWFLVCRILLLLIWPQPTPSGLGWHSTSQCSTMRSWTPLIVLATLQNRFASCPSISLSDLFSFWDMMSPRLYS